jgi:hypothetical protein
VNSLSGVGTNIDPMLCRADHLVGQVLGGPGHLPDIFTQIEVNFFLLSRLLGVKATDGKQHKVCRAELNRIRRVGVELTRPCFFLVFFCLIILFFSHFVLKSRWRNWQWMKCWWWILARRRLAGVWWPSRRT